ncbi:MAG: MFS transporter, partial [Candidatus Coatesbacteria bacterium]|nr:MFS transporter [Candidatus Coatesbacteria bacterium]
FVIIEFYKKSPVLNVRLFAGNRTFAMSNLAALINYSATAATLFLLSSYLQIVKGLAPQQAGLVMLSQPFIQAICSPLAGKLSDRIEPRVVASVGMSLNAIGLALLIFLDSMTPLWFIVAVLIVLGLGFGFFSSPNTNAVMGSVDKKLYGFASATVSTFRLVGMTMSMGIVMLLISLQIGDAKLMAENQDQFLKVMEISFTVFAALCAVGVAASLARGKLNRE